VNKIELIKNDIFLLKMISYRSLVKNKEYSVNSPNGIYKRMIFLDYDPTYNFGLTTGMAHEYMMWTYGTFIKYHDQKNGCYHFGGDSLFYDPEEIKKNAQKARQTMEQRTLNMILKRLVNEHFEWS
jgi:hypothetical protein